MIELISMDGLPIHARIADISAFGKFNLGVAWFTLVGGTTIEITIESYSKLLDAKLC